MNNLLLPLVISSLVIFHQALMEVEQERIKEDSKKLDVTMHHLHEKIRNVIFHLYSLFYTMHNVGFRSQEKSYIDEKITEVQKTVALMASDNGERERREEMREEFRRLNTTVQSVKEVLDKNEDKIGEIVMKVENLVSVYHNVSVFLL